MNKLWLTVLIFLSFITVNVIYHRNQPGDDLSSSYIACRLLAEGEEGHLYSFDPEYFHIIEDPVWIDIARKTSFRGFLHPYVQTPLWAYILVPLCEVTNFQTFNLLFLILNFSSIAATVWLVSYQWASSFLAKPVWLVGFLAAFSLITPTYYMAFLNQTHPLFLFATILAVFLASQKQDMLSGFVLAIAASIKITPAIIAIHWLISGRRKSAKSFLLWSAILGILTFSILGEKISLEYLSNLNRISNTLLVSYNNQSLAAWFYGNSYDFSEILNWRIYPLPIVANFLGFCLIGLVIMYFTIAYRRTHNNPKHIESLGVSSLLIASTVFTPIAWNHYYIILAVPLLVLVDHGSKTKKLWLLIGVGIIAILNIWPIAPHPLKFPLYPFTILRSHFFSGVICLSALLLVARNSPDSLGSKPANESRMSSGLETS